MISQEAIQEILGIREKVCISPKDMARKLNITFYPNNKHASNYVRLFSERLQQSFRKLNVNIIPYENSWERVKYVTRFRRFLKYNLNNLLWIIRKQFGSNETRFFLPFKSIVKLCGSHRIKKGISVVCVGEQDVENLHMQHISSFKSNSIITILDFPKNINFESSFSSHFDTAMSLFAYHMTNIIIAVDNEKWMVYNFNASHPIYKLDDKKFDEYVLKTLIPKIFSPINPHRFKEFAVSGYRFDLKDKHHNYVVEEMRDGARLFDKTNLYPTGKKIDQLPFRHNFHRLIGKLHLDNRSGMSFGFIAFQMPVILSEVIPYHRFESLNRGAFIDKDFFIDKHSREIFVLVSLKDERFVMKIPDVWVMTLRSGSDKTHFDPDADLLKIGLKNGGMQMEFPQGLKINRDYKPSFDTKVILAHAVGNSIVASILKYLDSNNIFPTTISERGISISHWHGYFNKDLLPQGVMLYGSENPHVACSSPQSAVFALGGKLESFFGKIERDDISGYSGDIHIEPHHGINISFPSLVTLAQYILDNPLSTELGNKYL